MPALFDEIESAYQRFAADWKTNDGARIAGSFVEDGALINPFGERADGRAAIGAMYSEYFRGMLGGTSTGFKLARVRSVESGHALADAEQTIYGPDGKVVLVVHLAALLRREGDHWRFVDGRPYTFAAKPA
jgi:uncharacterized protein (TIGR02246 family)